MPAACKGYLVPVYANYIIASICMAMNYEIQVDPAMIQFTKSVSEREGEDQNETTEIDTETTETATDNSESEKNTDENLEEPLQEEEQGKLEKSSEPLIDENLQKPPSDVDDQSGKNFKNSGKGARRRSSMFKSRRSSKKSDAFTGSSVTAVLAATALLLF